MRVETGVTQLSELFVRGHLMKPADFFEIVIDSIAWNSKGARFVR